VTDKPDDIRALAEAVDRDGGAVLREPLGEHTLLLCALPIDRVAERSKHKPSS